MSRPQFSLAFLFVVLTACGVVLGFWRPAYEFGRSIEWSDPILAWWLILTGMLLGVGGVIAYLHLRR